MKRKFSSIRLTLARAKDFTRVNVYAGQRSVNRRWVEELSGKVEAGDFHEGRIAVLHDAAKVLGDGVCDLLMDGQHQCDLVVHTALSIPCRLHEYTTETGDTKEDVARIFAQYNVDLPRNRGDIAWIYAVQYGMEKWPRKIAKLCNTALGLIVAFSGGEGRIPSGCQHLTKEQNARLLGKHKATCEFVYHLLCDTEPKYPKHLMRSPVVAAIIRTREIARDDATLFWEGVRDGDLLKKSDPAYRLREWLIRTSVKSVVKREPVVTHREMYVRSLHFWNAFRGGPGASGRYYPEKPIPAIK